MKINTERSMRLGARVRNNLGVFVSKQTKCCGDIYRSVRIKRKGNKIVSKRVCCFTCGKRQYGKNAEVAR